MTTESKELAVKNTPYNRFKNLIKSDNVQERFQQLLEDRADYFLGSLMSLVTADNKLLECDPATIFQAAAKAAVLRLPVAKELGFAWIVPYGKKAEFVLGYKGMVQLAIRTSQYDILNTVVIYEGMEVTEDVLAGTISIKGERNGDEAVGYAAYFKLLNGFQKFQYMSSEDVAKHAQRYSASYQYGMRTGKKDSAWFTNFDEMAKKTVLRLLLSKWGLMSIEMLSADVSDMPAIGDDERLAIPRFDDLNNPLDGSFREEEPDRENEQPESPDNIDDGEGEQPKPQPNPIAEAMVNADMADNIFNANAIIQLLELEGETKWTKAIEKKVKGYRGWRDIGAEPTKAANLIKKGEYPK